MAKTPRDTFYSLMRGLPIKNELLVRLHLTTDNASYYSGIPCEMLEDSRILGTR